MLQAVPPAPVVAESAPVPVSVPAPSPAIVGAATADDSDAVEGDGIDESDPLWIVTLRVAEGDREKAVRMLEDPDSLMKYPEIRAIMEAGDAESAEVPASDDWEQAGTVGAISAAVDENPSPDIAASSSASASSLAVDGDEVLEAEPQVVLSEGDPREHLNIVFIGHVDAGKSTLSGCILFNMGYVDARTIERYEREAKARNRESWFLAFIMDTSEEERAKGITVEVGRAHFETETYRYTILDAPGHKNYVPNMIAGAAQADVGILVISARKGEFETGFEKGGQTREHALLAKTLGKLCSC